MNRSTGPSERRSGAVLRRTGEGRVPCTRHPPSTHLTTGRRRSVPGVEYTVSTSLGRRVPGLFTPSRPGHRPQRRPATRRMLAAEVNGGDEMSDQPDQSWHPSALMESIWQRDVVGPMQDFQDPSQEWRRLFSEVLGTFFLVLVACGGGVMGQAFPNTISRTAAVTAPGLMVLAIILFMGKISGAHLNPAVSVAFALRRDFPWW